VADEREQAPMEDYLGHGEKILVVDDEARRRDPYIKLLFDIAAQT
jgi:hypothetical protein